MFDRLQFVEMGTYILCFKKCSLCFGRPYDSLKTELKGELFRCSVILSYRKTISSLQRNFFTKKWFCFYMPIKISFHAIFFFIWSSGIISRCQKYINLYYTLIYCSLIENINQFKKHRITKKDITTMKFNTLNNFNWSELVSLEKRIWIILQFLFLAKKNHFLL